jgi:cobalt-zinc-cadmium efflux system membrane fusion protein
MNASLAIDLSGDPEERTIDLIAEPDAIASWARAGVSAHLEITLDGAVEELAVPLACVVRDGVTPIIFRRDPANADKVIRVEADVGISDGRWIAILSGVREGDEIVLAGNYQLMLASSGAAPKGGHFHSDGTWHEGEH